MPLSDAASYRRTIAFVYSVLPIAGLILIGCASCAVGPDFTRPEAPKSDQYTVHPLAAATSGIDADGHGVQHFVPGAAVPTKWWTMFHSAGLDDLVDQAFKANPTVQSAQAALRQSRETMLAAIGVLIPAVDASGSGERQRISGAQFGPGSQASIFNLYNASVNISYGLDFFGGSRRELEALRARTDYQRHVLEATYLTLADNVVTTAIAEASLRAQIAATDRIIDLSSHHLEIIKKQKVLGGASGADLLAQESELAQDRAALPGLRDQLDRQRSLLATLLGRLPADQPSQTFELADLQLPQDLPVSLPSQLVSQRPDVRQMVDLLHAASAEVGVATANMLPQITLTGSYGGSSATTGGLFDAANRAWSLGAGVTQPLVHGGRLLHQRRASVAAYEQAQADYRVTVLNAFRDVGDTLRALANDADALNARMQAAQTAASSRELAEKQFAVGGTSFLVLLNAQRVERQADLLRIQAQASRYADTVALYHALGGGWAR